MVLPVSISVMACSGLISAREPRGAAKAGMQAQHHFREAEARVFDGDAIMAGERDLEPAAEAVAVDDRDRRQLQRVQPIDDRMGGVDPRLDLAGIAGAAKLADIGAGDEAGPFCRADHEAVGRLGSRSRRAWRRTPRSPLRRACWRRRPRVRTEARRRRRCRASA